MKKVLVTLAVLVVKVLCKQNVKNKKEDVVMSESAETSNKTDKDLE